MNKIFYPTTSEVEDPKPSSVLPSIKVEKHIRPLESTHSDPPPYVLRRDHRVTCDFDLYTPIYPFHYVYTVDTCERCSQERVKELIP